MRFFDPATEEALIDTPVTRRFARIGWLDAIPDEMTILWRWCWRGAACPRSFFSGSRCLQRKGLSLRSSHDRRCDHHPCAEFDEERGLGQPRGLTY